MMDLLPHLAENEIRALEAFLARLREHYPDQVQHVILFGSKVRGDFDEESDIDLLIVVQSDDWRFHDKVSGLAFDPMLEHDVLLSTHVMGQKHYEEIRRIRTSFFRNLQREGIELWTKESGKRSASY